MTKQTAPVSHQARPDGILPNVSAVVFVILCVANAVIYKTCLPYLRSKMDFLFRPIGETALDELECLF